MAGLSTDLRKLLNTPEPPTLGPERRPGALAITQINASLKKLGQLASASSEQLLRATVYLWHDHLEEAHSIAQEIGGPEGSYLHGIMHRREPDYGNARYWFNRVGKHPCFIQLAKRSEEILASGKVPELARSLNKSGQWDPYAFIAACERAVQKGNTTEIQQLREIQAAELEILLEHFAAMGP